MYTMITFQDSGGSKKISFSELVNKNQMFIATNFDNYIFTEKEMRELRTHLTRQIKKLNLNTNK